MPALTFSYQVQAASFEAESDWKITSQTTLGDPYGTSPGTPDAQLVDINGDGLPDWVARTNNQPYTSFNVQLNTGNSFTTSLSPWSPIKNETDSTSAAWNNLDSAYSHFLDMDGDLLPDRVMQQFNSPFSSFKLQLNTGNGFNSSVASWSGVASQNSNYFTDTLNVPFATTADGIASLAVLADINGDGLPDRVMLSSTSGRFDVQLNRSGSFGSIIPWSNVASATGSGINTPAYYSPRARNNSTVFSELIDLNGDGLPDRIIAGKVQLNDGILGFGSVSSWGLSSSDYPGVVNAIDGDYTTALVDINGDGLPDLVTLSGSSFTVRVNTGRGFSSTTKSWSNVSVLGHNGNGWNAPHAWDANGTRVLFADVNGDGLPDRVVRFNYQGNLDDYLAVQLNAGPYPDLLSSVSNGIGGAVLVAYQPSTTYNNSDGTRPRLPFPLYTVSTVTKVDGRGAVAVTTYNYAGGYYDTLNREFRGFAWVRVTDPLGAYTDTYFHQGGGTNGTPLGEFQDDLAKAGMAYRTEIFGSDDKLYQRTLQKVNEVTLHSNGVYFPFVQQVTTLDYEGTSSYRAIAKGYAYQASANNLAGSTGNLLGETNYSEVSSVNLSTHAFTNNVTGAPPPVYRQFTYATITSNSNIVDRPAVVTVSADTIGTIVLQQTTNQYYAGNGNLKFKAERICPDSYVVTTFNYDAYGNLTSATDPAGVVNTTDYDTATATFPTRSYVGSLANQLITYTQYDLRSGQVLASTNQAGLVSANSYDVFFRLTNSAISTTTNGPANLWRVRYEYRLGGMSSAGVSTNYVRMLRNDPADAVNGQHETYTYSDGLGRPIQARDEAENGQYRVSDLFYDNRGAVVLQEYPLFQNGSVFSKPSGTRTNVYTRFDAIGRAWRTDPFASITVNSFGNWNGNTPTILTGDTGSPVGPTSLAFKEGTNPWVLIATNALNKLRKFYLDAQGRTNLIVEVTSQGSYSNYLAYDMVGNLTNLTDSVGNQSSYYFNNLGQKVAQADPDLGFWQFARDVAGRLKTQTDARGQQIKLFYSDPAGRLTRREGWNSANQMVSLATYAYDNNGGDNQYTVFPSQLFQVTDDEGWQKFSYDFRGRVLKSVRYLAKNGQTYTNLYTHDDADRLSSTTYPNSGPTVTNVYDLGGNLSNVQRVDGGGSPIVYYTAQGIDELARLTGITFGNGAASTFGYYKVSKRLNQIITTIPGGTQVQNFTNRYDAFGNILAIQDNAPTHTGAASATLTNAVYDDLNRLTSAGWTGYGLKNYGYDKVGNILTNSEFGAGAYNYYANRAHAVKGANGAWYTYDRYGQDPNYSY